MTLAEQLTEYIERRLKITVALYVSCSHEGKQDLIWAKIEVYKEILAFLSERSKNE